MTAQGSTLQAISIERMGYGPEAVGHLASGKAVFVPGAAPGDVVSVEVVEDRPTFARARLAEVLEPGEARVAAPACAGACGGCPWAHLSYEAQLAAKRASVADALVRVGRFERAEVEALVAPCAPSARQWGYRNKVELACAVGADGNPEVGLSEHGTGRLVPLERCPLAPKAIERAPRALRGALRFALGGQDLGLFRIGVRHSLRTRETEIALWTRPGAFVADLYSGVGTFTLPLAQAGCDVAAVESAGSSVRDLRRNAEAAGVDVEVIGGDAARELPELGRLDALVVDPPRSGLQEGIVEAIAAAAPEAMSYVSCDPQTWARDMARLAAAGYRLQAATPVDLVPQTYHVEVASILRRA